LNKARRCKPTCKSNVLSDSEKVRTLEVGPSAAAAQHSSVGHPGLLQLEGAGATEAKLGELEAALEEQGTKVTQVDHKVNQVDQKLEALDGKIDQEFGKFEHKFDNKFDQMRGAASLQARAWSSRNRTALSHGWGPLRRLPPGWPGWLAAS
jgi:hypothetical protein